MLKSKRRSQLAALLALSLASQPFLFPVASVYALEEQDLETGIEYGKQIKSAIDATKAADAAAKAAQAASQAAQAAQAAQTASQAAGAATSAASAASTATAAASKTSALESALGKAGAVMGAYGSVTQIMSDPSNIVGDMNALNDLANSASSLGVNIGLGADFGLATSIVGSVFGEKISDSMTYRSVGSHGKYTCSSSTPNPTINEPVEVQCFGVPIAGAAFIVPPTLSFHAKPTSGGKRTFVGGGVPWKCNHHGCYPVGAVAVTIEYNTYEGEVTMGGDLYFQNQDWKGLFDKQNNDSFNFGEGYTYDPNVNFSGTSAGDLTNGVFEFYSHQGDGSLFGGGSGDSSLFNGGYGGQGGNFGLDANGNAYDWNGGDYGSKINSDLNETGNGSFNANGDDWSTSGGGSAGTDNLDNYFNSSTSGTDDFDGSSGMSTDDTGIDAANAIMSAKDALANGGYIENGNVYDADGNSWGSAENAGLIAMEEGSDQYNNVLAQGGWVDENGFLHDANGNIVGYTVPEGSQKDNSEENSFEDESFFEKSKSMLEDFLASLGNANGGDASLMDRLSGESGENGLVAAIKSAFGLKSAEDIRKETMTPQQMYDISANILKELGYTDEDIANGKNYDKDSAYTEPDKAWDMNRITTLQKNFKIDTGIRVQNKGNAMMNAAARYGALKPTQQSN